MELSALKFSLDTSELDTGIKKIESLTTAVDQFNKVNKDSIEISNKSSKATKDLADSQSKLKDAADKTAKASTEVETKISPLEKLLGKLNNQYGDLVSGFTKGEATILQQARNFGAVEQELKPFIEVLGRIKELTKDPFDASIGSIRSIASEFDRVTQRANLMAQGISLTTKQLGEYSRLAAEVKGVVSKMDLDPTQGEGLQKYNQLLKQTQSEYLALAAQVNKLEAEEKTRNTTLRETERISASINNALRKDAWMEYSAGIGATSKELKQLNDYYRTLEESSKRVDQANERTIESVERLGKITNLIRQGMSESEATKVVDLSSLGVEETTIKRLIQANRDLAQAKKDVASASGNAGSGMSDSAKAAAWLEREIARAKNAVSDLNEELRVSTSNRLFKFEEQLRKAGISGEEAKRMMDDYRNTIIVGQQKANAQMDKELRNLARAVSVQMGDVAVSLASGMNPLLVMIQQGDQLRYAFQQVEASAGDVRKSMQTAAAMIATSFIDVGKAIGSFFLGALISVTKQVTTLVTGPLTAMVNVFKTGREQTLGMASAIEILSAGLNALKVATVAALPTLLASAAIAAVALSVAFVQVSRQEDELSKQLALSGASLGLNKANALALAAGMESLGVSTSKSVDLITAFAKEGGFLRSEMQALIPVGAKLMETFKLTGDEVAKLFAKVKKDPVEALYELATSMGTVNVEALRFVEEQMKIGNTLGATEAALREAARVHNNAAEEMKQDYSTLGLVINSTKNFFKGFWDGVKGLVYTPNASEKMRTELSSLSDEIMSVEKNLGLLNKIGVGGDDSYLKQLKDRAEALREAIGLQQKQSEVQIKNKETAAAQAKAMQELAKAAEKAASPYEKYIQLSGKIIEDMQTAAGDSQAQADGIKALTKAKEDYLKALEKENKLTKEERAAAREAKRIQDEALSALQKIENLTNKGIQTQEHYTAAQKLALDIFKDPDFAKYPEKLREQIALKITEAHQSEILAKAEIERLKTMREMNKLEEQKALSLDKVWNNQVELSAAVGRENEELAFRIGLLNRTGVEQEKLMAQYKARVQLEKELVDIRSSDVSDSEKANMEQMAVQRYSDSMKNANTAIALDFVSKIGSSFDSAGSGTFEKSAGRFAEALRDVGNVSFANVINSLSQMATLFDSISKQQEYFTELRAKAGTDEKKLGDITALQKKAELKSYGDIAGAAKGFFKEGTKGYKTLSAAEKAFRAYEMAMAVKSAAVKIAENASVVGAIIAGDLKTLASAVQTALESAKAWMIEGQAKAVAAVAGQGAGDPYTAFARIAAMIAIMGALGFAVSGGSGGGGMKSNSGTGTVFGDKGKTDKYGNHIDGTGAQSATIANSLAILEDVNTLTMQYSAAMLATLRSIDSQISGVTNLVLRNAINTNQASTVQTGTKLASYISDPLQSGILGGAVGLVVTALSKVPVIGKILGSLFGTKTSITSSGIYANDTTVGALANGGLSAGYYTDVNKKKKAFGITYSSKNSTITQQDDVISQQFALILNNFVDVIKAAAVPLGSSLGAIDQRLNNFVISLGKIDIKGLTGDEIQEKLAAVFGAAGDKLAEAALPGFERFQQVGEGYLETIVRVANSVETVTSWFDTLGFSMKSLSVDKAMDLVELFGGLDKLGESFDSFYGNFYSDSEKTATLTRQLTSAFSKLGVAMPVDRLEYRALVEKALASGNQELAATLLKLSDAFAQITPEIQDVVNGISEAMQELQSENANLKIELLRVQGYTQAADRAFRELAIKGLTATEIAVWDANRALEAQIETIKKTTQERTSLESRLLELQGNTAAIRARELAALEPANRALQEQIWLIEDQAKLVAEQNAIDAEKYSLETKLLGLQGDTAKLRARELEKLNPVNRALQEQIWALEDAQKATEELKNAWQSVTDSIYEEVKRIRGLTGSDASNSYAMVKGQFDAALLAARNGDKEAAAALPELSQSLLELAATQAKTSYELRLIQLQTANSLESVANAIAGKYGVTTPTSTNAQGGMSSVGDNVDLISYGQSGTAYSTTNTTSANSSSSVQELLVQLNTNIDGLRYEIRANVSHTAKIAKIISRVNQDSETLSVSFVAPQQVSVV